MAKEIQWPISWTYGDRLFITGPSGSGKTTVAKAILVQKSNGVIIDTKNSGEDGFEEIAEPVTWRDLKKVRAGRFVWAASEDFIVDAKVQDRFFRGALRGSGRWFYVDEAFNLIKTPGLKIFLAQCRGMKVSPIIGAQRPSGIPLGVVNDSNLYIVFNLALDDDRKRMQTAIGRKIPWEQLEGTEHSFMIFNNKGGVGGPFVLADPRKRRIA